MRPYRLMTAGIALVVTMGTSTAQPPTERPHPKDEVGLTRELAIEVCMPEGEREYLDLLRCPEGSAPAYDRTGSVGLRSAPATEQEQQQVMDQMMRSDQIPEGQKDFHMLDLYEVRCPKRTYEIYMDMYHCQENPARSAPEGLRLESE